MQLLAYGAWDLDLDWSDNEYKVGNHVVITDNYSDLIKHGYDPDKYDYEKNERWIKYNNQLVDLEKLLYNTKNSVTTITIWKYVEEEKNTCPVTYENINLKEYYYHCSQCKNNYKNEVYTMWLKKNKSCPMCRYKINTQIRYYNTKKTQPKQDTIKHKIEDLEFRIKKLKEYMYDIESFYRKKDDDYQQYIIDKAVECGMKA